MTAEFYEEEQALATQQAAAQLANGNNRNRYPCI